MKYLIAIGGNEPIKQNQENDSFLPENWNPNGKLIKISDEDVDLTDESWVLFKGAVIARSKTKSSKGKRFLMQLHRLIAQRIWANKSETSLSHNHIVKFKDGDKYNMQRENIEICERGQLIGEKARILKEAKEIVDEINKEPS